MAIFIHENIYEVAYHHRFAVDFFARYLQTRTAVARLPYVFLFSIAVEEEAVNYRCF